MPPVWVAKTSDQGVVIGACIVSAATATEVGATGVKRAPWANAPFIPGALGDYMDAQFNFFRQSQDRPGQTADDGRAQLLSDRRSPGRDHSPAAGRKAGRAGLAGLAGKKAHGDVEAIDTPIGGLPKYEDLKALFADIIEKQYPEELYLRQFSLYVDNIVARIDLQIEAYGKETGIPDRLFDILREEKKALLAVRETFGPVVSPAQLETAGSGSIQLKTGAHTRAVEGRSRPQRSILHVVFSARMLVALLMGFSCGLPLLLTISVLQAWMKEEGVDLTVIGLMTLVGLPYTLKFLWAPLLDRFTLPFLGRRRGWLLIAQMALVAAIAGLGLTDPAPTARGMVALAALLVTFFSATQDIVVDAYRREDLTDEELGLGSSLYVNGYRVGMLLASGGGLILADQLSFSGGLPDHGRLHAARHRDHPAGPGARAAGRHAPGASRRPSSIRWWNTSADPEPCGFWLSSSATRSATPWPAP